MRVLLISISLLITATSYGCVCSTDKFDSLEDIEQYKFIGLVKIDSIFILPVDTIGGRISHHTSFSILEFYRGDSLSQLQVSGGNHNLNIRRRTSCDMSLNPGDEWMLFAYETPDSILQTGYCTYSKLYRSKDGRRDWHYRRGFEEIEKVKKLLNIQDEIDSTMNGIFTETYPNGSVEVESEYRNGRLNGTRKIRYQDGQLMTQEKYLDGLKNGSSKWFYEDGMLKRAYTYKNDNPIDSCWHYHENGSIARRNFFSSKGTQLYSAYYAENGWLENSYEADTLNNEYIQIRYYESGKKRSVTANKIGEYSNSNTIQYYESGKIEGTWTHFDEGDFKTEIKRWNEDGELTYHQRTTWNGEKVILKKAGDRH